MSTVGGESPEEMRLRLRREVAALTAHEARVGRAVATAERALHAASVRCADHAYITYADLRSIAEFRQQTVIPIKAPPDTSLNVRPFRSHTPPHARNRTRIAVFKFLHSNALFALEYPFPRILQTKPSRLSIDSMPMLAKLFFP